LQDNPTVALERELYLIFSDLYEGSFIFTDSGDLYIIDFDLAAFLPLSFQTFALHYPSMMSMLVAEEIKDEFDLPEENLHVMGVVANLIGRSGLQLGKLAECVPLPTEIAPS
jgi:hypothetical protein